ncbi:MAG: HD domain-containing protein [Candidatus Omnitrophota bacterium]|nr:HD domain-containing protein [Candidatus Omnitrophota bacterium]MDZ4241457.1 HD domain-containing protein [Candidatus Omnitrophota bacterium]
MRTGKKTSRGPSRGDLTAALNFFAEAGLLKKVKRSGWWVAGIKDPESVAEHSFRTAVIGFYLAYLEGVDPFQVMTMCLFNDIHEARINDLHKMGHFYINFKEAEKKVFADQMKALAPSVRKKLEEFRRHYDDQQSPESLVARDADILECLLQAKEYYDEGYLGARLFFARAPKFLKSAGARKLWGQIRRWKSHGWWQNVVSFQR